MTNKHPIAPRVLALTGMLLVSLNLRTAVSSLSPVIPFVQEDINLGTLTISMLGMLPPLCFALAGLLAPVLTRKVGLELALIILMAGIVAGHLLRAFSTEWQTLSLGTLLALLGMGMGNVLLPVVVRKYFKDRIASMTALYLVLVSVSAFVPPLVAVGVAQEFGWRTSLGQWAVIAFVAILPWLFELRRNKVEEEIVTQALTIPLNVKHIKIWKSPTAIAMVVIWGVSSINGYAMFAWLPQILVDTSGVTA
ncbi:MAG: CynX/NimT family MFS transporter, partial [Actinomycetota bacterium]